jgi:hypothetical protein
MRFGREMKICININIYARTHACTCTHTHTHTHRNSRQERRVKVDLLAAAKGELGRTQVHLSIPARKLKGKRRDSPLGACESELHGMLAY